MKLGQRLGTKLSGVHRFLSQPRGQTRYPGRRGWKDPNLVVVGPLRWPEHHHKVVVVGDVAAETEQTLPCRCLWGKVGATEKLVKIKWLWKLKVELVENKYKQDLTSKSTHIIHNNYHHIWKNLRK